MAVKTRREQDLEWWLCTLETFLREMKKDKLRVWGKILATIVIGSGIFLGEVNGDIGASAISLMWVITIPSIVEAWIIAKNRQQETEPESA